EPRPYFRHEEHQHHGKYSDGRQQQVIPPRELALWLIVGFSHGTSSSGQLDIEAGPMHGEVRHRTAHVSRYFPHRGAVIQFADRREAELRVMVLHQRVAVGGYVAANEARDAV